MPEKIYCPHCSQAIEVDNREAIVGQEVKCPDCKETFVAQMSNDEDEFPAEKSGFLMSITSAEKKDAVAPGSIWKGVIDYIRGKFNAEQLRSMGRRMANVGTYSMVAGVILYGLYWVVFGLKGSLSFNETLGEFTRKTNWYLVLFGLAAASALTAVQFVNQRLLTAIESQVDSSPTRVSTTAVFDALGILFLVLAVSLPVYSIYDAIQSKLYFMIFVGIAASVVCGYLALVAMNPEFLNIQPDEEATAADDALALYAFGVKVYIAAIPMLYGILVVLGCGGLMLGMLQISMEAEAVWVTAVHIGGISAFHIALVLPFVGYLLGIFALLSLFLIQAILSIPGKLDVLNKS